ncbi:hypothetical protein EBB59_09715 [Lysobacter pythonis]|uniref:Uncharacterized protein n=1 Tax=Solilutibacter pythonis TaxID=2483112 RepID=A0A3M2HYH4_9GAMM|nr:hypothetical protein [Lysobacter pythonis]RMH90884.1 hypothetical protein EBB59_09715 [Lysobacter pythonis]
MNTQEAQIPPNPTLSAEEVGRRFLKFIEGVESRGDITLERVQEVMGLTLKRRPIDRGFFHTQSLIGDWSYVIILWPHPEEEMRNSLNLEFINKINQFSDMLPICGLSFEGYHKALLSFGYSEIFRYDKIGRLSGVSYSKGNMHVGITPELKVFPNGKAYPTCVRRIGLLAPY